MAKSTNVTLIKLNNSKSTPTIYSWEIVTPEKGAGIAALEEPRTVIVYVNKHLVSNPSLASDPVRLNCSGVLTIINPGSSALCEIPVNWATSWEVESGYFSNGSDGVVIAVE